MVRFSETNSLSLSNGATAQGGPRPPLGVSFILPGLGRLLSNFYILASLHLPPLHLPNAVWVSLWGVFLLAHWELSWIDHHPGVWHVLPIPVYSTCRISQCHFRRQITKHKMSALIFSTIFVWNISHSKKINWDVNINLHRSSYKVPVILVRFSWNLNSRQIFEKSSNIEFHEPPSSGSRVVPCGQTDRHDEGNSRSSKFWERP